MQPINNPLIQAVRLFLYYMRCILAWLGLGRKGRFLKQNVEYFKDCRKSFFQMIVIRDNMAEYVNSYKNKTVKPIRVLTISHKANTPILLCAVKDDLARVKAQLKYYRNIGITHFAYIDNMSTDGTFECLLEQHDVSLFRVDEKFNATIKNAWRRQVTDMLGYDQWYLIVDSDEFFTYPGIESHSINEYIDFLEQENIHSAFSLMVDMYSNEPLFNASSISEEDFLKGFCYFDTDTYRIRKRQRLWLVTGGPRKRVFSTEKNYLTKYPLIKLSKSMIVDTHNNYPFKLSFETSFPIGFLLHYKFLPHDSAIYEERIKSGVYKGGSFKYKKMKEVYTKNPHTSFYYNKSQKLNDSLDLMNIKLINKKFFDRFLNNEFI